jgi:hypothetical protein
MQSIPKRRIAPFTAAGWLHRALEPCLGAVAGLPSLSSARQVDRKRRLDATREAAAIGLAPNNARMTPQASMADGEADQVLGADQSLGEVMVRLCRRHRLPDGEDGGKASPPNSASRPWRRVGEGTTSRS